MFQEMFTKANGQSIIYKDKRICMIDSIQVINKGTLRVVFESTNSDWRQGICLDTDGAFIVAGHRLKKSIVLWADTAPPEVRALVLSKKGVVQFYNVWDMGDGVMHYWHNGGAMVVENALGGKRVYCNDGRADDDFDDLVVVLDVLVA